jgi:hypothetical protein
MCLSQTNLSLESAASFSIPVKGSGDPAQVMERSDGGLSRGSLILNADDWGRDKANTDRTLECFSPFVSERNGIYGGFRKSGRNRL